MHQKKAPENYFTDDDVWKYCLKHMSGLSPTLEELAESTKKEFPKTEMLSGPIITKILEFAIFFTQAKICVDIGTFTGMSAIAMAEAAPEADIYTIDEIDQSGNEIAEEFIDKYPNIIYHQADNSDDEDSEYYTTQEILSLHLPNNIDVAFIDADKKSVVKYFKIMLGKLSDRGIIIIDDALWKGKVLKSNPQDERARAFNDLNHYIRSEGSLDNIILPIRNGINIVRKNKRYYEEYEYSE